MHSKTSCCCVFIFPSYLKFDTSCRTGDELVDYQTGWPCDCGFESHMFDRYLGTIDSHTMLPNFFHGHNLSIYLLLLRLNVMLDSYLNKNKSKYETWITGNVLAERQNKSVLLLCMTPSFLEHHVAIKELTVILICVFFVFDLHFLCGVFFVLSVFFHFSA